jgi:hypothetical protein
MYPLTTDVRPPDPQTIAAISAARISSAFYQVPQLDHLGIPAGTQNQHFHDAFSLSLSDRADFLNQLKTPAAHILVRKFLAP